MALRHTVLQRRHISRHLLRTLTEAMLKGDDDMQKRNENTLSIRRKLIGQLKSEGKTYFEISQVLNLSEYQVKKLWRGLLQINDCVTGTIKGNP